MKLTKERLEQLADVSCLSLAEEEKELFLEQINQMIQLAKKLEEVNTEGVQPTVMGMPVTNRMREDERRPSAPREEVLACAQDHKDGMFRVPAIFEE